MEEDFITFDEQGKPPKPWATSAYIWGPPEQPQHSMTATEFMYSKSREAKRKLQARLDELAKLQGQIKPPEEPMTLSKFIDNNNIKIELEVLASSDDTATEVVRAVMTKSGRIVATIRQTEAGASHSKTGMFKAWYASSAVSQEVVRHFLGGRCYNALCKCRGLVPASGRRQPKEKKGKVESTTF